MHTIISDTYTWSQFYPVFALVGVAVALLMADAFLPKLPRKSYALIGAACTFVAGCFMMGGQYYNLAGVIACLATAACLVMSYDYNRITCDAVAGGDEDEGTGEFYALPIIACAGIVALTQARDLITLFVSLEVVTLSSYVLVGYYRRNQGSIEAGVKYLVLGALSTGFLVFGMSWYFGGTGTFQLGVFESGTVMLSAYLLGLALIFLGICFKIGAAPMHGWIPDVYQGAPTPISAFLAVASKTAGFAALIAVLQPIFLTQICKGQVDGAPTYDYVSQIIYVLSIVMAATLLIGNLGAITQKNVKRLLGYSSIGQAGFMLAFFLSPHYLGANVYLYLAAYGLATIGAFTAIGLVRAARGSEEVAAFRGLGKTNPRLSFLITVCFASLAGVPLTAGFLAKFMSFSAIIAICEQQNLYWLLIIMIITAAAGFYYYFKVLRAIYWEKADPSDAEVKLPLASGLLLSVCVLATILIGTIPMIIEM